jgi:hypothetical protein
VPRAAVGLLEQRGDQLGHGPRARCGAHALQQRGQQRVVLHALRERVERVVRQHAQRERQVRPGRHELREHDGGARHLRAQLGRVVGVGALGERGQDLVRELGGVCLGEDEQQLEQLRRLQPLGGRPHLELGDHRVDERAEVRAEALARAVARARAREGRVERECHRRVGRGLVFAAVLDLGAVLFLVGREVQVLGAERVHVPQRLLARRRLTVGEAVHQVGGNAHLLGAGGGRGSGAGWEGGGMVFL